MLKLMHTTRNFRGFILLRICKLFNLIKLQYEIFVVSNL